MNYIIIPFVTFLTASIGSYITQYGMDWYKTINLPTIAPEGSFIGTIWTIIFILTTMSVILFYKDNQASANFKLIILLFVVNAVLNVFWSQVFFGWHLIGWSIVEMFVLNATNLALIFLLWGENVTSAVLLVPYFLWVSFATYLTYLIWGLN